jgi:hypothetical protein
MSYQIALARRGSYQIALPIKQARRFWNAFVRQCPMSTDSKAMESMSKIGQTPRHGGQSGWRFGASQQPRRVSYQIALWMIAVSANNTYATLVGARTRSRWPRFGAHDLSVRSRVRVMARRCAGSSGSLGLALSLAWVDRRKPLESLMFFCLLRNSTSIKS